MNPLDPHGDARVLAVGPALSEANGALIMLHGRGANAEDILGLYQSLNMPGLAALALDATDNHWYPNRFMDSIKLNEPWLTSALNRVSQLVESIAAQGVPLQRIALLGFSQGACLSCEFVARNPARYGAVLGLTGGLIGPVGTPRDYAESLDGTPVFLGTSAPDPHIPLARVQETKEVLERMGAAVEMRTYPGMPHTINDEELDVCRGMLEEMIKGAPK